MTDRDKDGFILTMISLARFIGLLPAVESSDEG